MGRGEGVRWLGGRRDKMVWFRGWLVDLVRGILLVCEGRSWVVCRWSYAVIALSDGIIGVGAWESIELWGTVHGG